MAFDAHTNFAMSTVAVAPSPATSGLSLTVASGDGALYGSGSGDFTVCPAGTEPLKTNAEIVRGSFSGDVLTITTRGAEGSTVRAIQVGDQIFAGVTAKTLTDIETAVNNAVPKSTWTAKGDVLVATASATPAVLGIGANGTILTADSTQASGVKWGPAPAANVVAVKTANYTASLNEVVRCDTTGGSFTVTLPAATGGRGRVVVVWVAGTIAPLIALSGSDHFNTSAGSTTPMAPTGIGAGFQYESDGTSVWTATTGRSIPDPTGSGGSFLGTDGSNIGWFPVPAPTIRAQNAAWRFTGGISTGDVSESWHVWDAAHLTRGPRIATDQASSSDVLTVDVQYNTGSGWGSIFGTGPYPQIAAGNTSAFGATPTTSAIPAGADLRATILHAPPGPSTNPTAASFVANNSGNTTTTNPTTDSITIPGTPQAGDVVVLVFAEQGSTVSMASPWTLLGQQTSSAAFSTTGNTTSGSASLTVASATGIAAGQVISATGVPTGTTVSSITGTTVTMSANATATGTGVTVTFTPGIQSTLSLWAAPWASGMSTTVTLGAATPAAWWVGLGRGFDATTLGNSIFQVAGHTDGNSPGLGTGTVSGAGVSAASSAADIVLVAAAARYGSGSVGYTLSASGGPTGLASSANIVTSRTSATNVGLYVGLASAVAAGANVPATTWTTTGGSGGANSIADTTLTVLIRRPPGTSGPSVCTVQMPVDN